MTLLLKRTSIFPVAALLGVSSPALAFHGHDGGGHGHDPGHGTGHGHEDSDDGDDGDGDAESGDDGDDVACPCYTEDDLEALFDSSDLCFDYSATAQHGNGTYLAYYTGEGEEAGVADWYYAPVPFCAAVNLTTFAGPFIAPITPAEYDACAEIVLDVARDLHLPCSSTP